MSKLTTPVFFDIQQPDTPLREETFSTRSIKIGRLPSVHMCLQDPTVNRIHAVIEVTGPNKAQLIDMGSSKGTFVNGSRIHKAQLTSGDHIKLGNTILTIQIGTEAIENHQAAKWQAQEAELMAQVQTPQQKPPLASQPPTTETTVVTQAPQPHTHQPAPHTPTDTPTPEVSFWSQASQPSQPSQTPQPAPAVHAAPVYQVSTPQWTPYQEPQPPALQPQPAQQPSAQQPTPHLTNQGLPAQWRSADWSDNDALEVKVTWGDSTLEHAHFKGQQTITIGDSRKDTFRLGQDMLPPELISFPLIQADEGTVLVRWTTHMTGSMKIGNHAFSLHQLAQMGHARKTGEWHQAELPHKGTMQLQMGGLHFAIRLVSAPQLAPAISQINPDPALGRALGTSFLLHGFVLLFMLFADEAPQTFDESILKTKGRFGELIIRPKEKEKPKKRRIGSKPGAKAPKSEGKVGHKSDVKKVRRGGSTTSKKNPNAPFNMKKIKDAVTNQLLRKGILGVLPGGKVKSGGILDARAFGKDDANGLGGWHGGKVGMASGNNGLGLKGKGIGGGNPFGGGGVGWGKIGIPSKGKYGTIGHRGRLRNRRKHKPTLTVKEPTIRGCIDRKIIQRVIRRHRASFKYCYNRELIKNHQLEGKLIINFKIIKTGRVSTSGLVSTTMNNDRVEQCMLIRVKTMRFPGLKRCDEVYVNYPFVFQYSR
jgi:hypothetical protein